MLLDRNQMTGVITELIPRTNSGQLQWIADGDQLLVALPNHLTVTLTQQPNGDLRAIVERSPSEILGIIEEPNGSTPLTTLYQFARTSASRNIYDEILMAIRAGGSSGTRQLTGSQKVETP